jgi:hypothetical protein
LHSLSFAILSVPAALPSLRCSVGLCCRWLLTPTLLLLQGNEKADQSEFEHFCFYVAALKVVIFRRHISLSKQNGLNAWFNLTSWFRSLWLHLRG